MMTKYKTKAKLREKFYGIEGVEWLNKVSLANAFECKLLIDFMVKHALFKNN